MAQAGRKGAVTVSTNMAGRGTDILLGGNAEFMTKDACLKEKVAERLARKKPQYVADEHFYYFTHHDQFYRVRRDKWDELYAGYKARPTPSTTKWSALGGLHIVGHRAARIPAHRQPASRTRRPPGRPRQFALLPLPAGRPAAHFRRRAHAEPDAAARHGRGCADRDRKLITKRIAKAQEAVETQNFEARKHLLEYDDVNNKQRQAVYGMRRQLLEGIDQKERVMEMVQGIVEQFIDMRCPDDKHPDTWDLATLRNDILTQFGARIDLERTGQSQSPGDERLHLRAAAAEVPGEGRPGGRRT